MSIRSVIGNLTKSGREFGGTLLSSASAQLNGVVGTAGAAVGSVFSGGFVGIDENNIESVKNSINSYCDTIDGIIDGFDENAQLDNAFKGEVQQGVRQFVTDVKGLLKAYVTYMRRSVADLNTAVASYKAGVSGIRSQAQSDAESIRQQAAEVKID